MVYKYGCLVFFLLISSWVSAGVSIGGTRLIYDGDKKETSIMVSNPDNSPYLIQSWVDNEGKSTSKPPFIVTPPLFRLDNNQESRLRIMRAGGNLPSDRESLYWLNIKSIPSTTKTDENTLQIAIKTKIKLIFRPTKLTGSMLEAAEKLQWKRIGNQLEVNNNSPYYMNFYKVTLSGQPILGVTMVAPFSRASFPVSSSIAGNRITWQVINDFGGGSKVSQGGL